MKKKIFIIIGVILIFVIVSLVFVIKINKDEECCSCCDEGEEFCITLCCPCD